LYTWFIYGSLFAHAARDVCVGYAVYGYLTPRYRAVTGRRFVRFTAVIVAVGWFCLYIPALPLPTHSTVSFAAARLCRPTRHAHKHTAVGLRRTDTLFALRLPTHTFSTVGYNSCGYLVRVTVTLPVVPYTRFRFGTRLSYTLTAHFVGRSRRSTGYADAAFTRLSLFTVVVAARFYATVTFSHRITPLVVTLPRCVIRTLHFGWFTFTLHVGYTFTRPTAFTSSLFWLHGYLYGLRLVAVLRSFHGWLRSLHTYVYTDLFIVERYRGPRFGHLHAHVTLRLPFWRLFTWLRLLRGYPFGSSAFGCSLRLYIRVTLPVTLVYGLHTFAGYILRSAAFLTFPVAVCTRTRGSVTGLPRFTFTSYILHTGLHTVLVAHTVYVGWLVMRGLVVALPTYIYRTPAFTAPRLPPTLLCHCPTLLVRTSMASGYSRPPPYLQVPVCAVSHALFRFRTFTFHTLPHFVPLFCYRIAGWVIDIHGFWLFLPA